MKKYSRNDIKLSFIKESTKYFVNEKKGTVVCVVEACLYVPNSYDGPIFISNTSIKSTGVAKCHVVDFFNEERGKRIALAKAENNCYIEAIKYLRKQEEHLEYMLDCIDSFTEKGVRQCEHNKEYIERISDTEHPEYNFELTKLKNGSTTNH